MGVKAVAEFGKKISQTWERTIAYIPLTHQLISDNFFKQHIVFFPYYFVISEDRHGCYPQNTVSIKGAMMTPQCFHKKGHRQSMITYRETIWEIN